MDAILEELFRSGLKRYEKARKLLDEDSKSDPEKEPYRSQYAAREILTEIKADISRSLDHRELAVDVQTRLTTLLAATNYHLGVVCVETEEFSAGEELLLKCQDLIGCDEDAEISRERILLAMLTLNQLGILWSMRGELKRSAMYLERSKRLYKTYRSEVGLAPYDIQDLFTCDDRDDVSFESNWKIFEKTFTHTTYYMAQVYSGLKEVVKAAMYCHTTLRRQLEEGLEFDPVDWAVNAATLSQFFITKNDFNAARHHLACATHVLDQHEAKVLESSKDLNNEELFENIKHRRADVAVCWGKYGISLLSVSWQRLMQHPVSALVDNMNNAAIAADIVEQADGSEEAVFQSSDGTQSDKCRMTFDSLEVTYVEESVTANYILEFNEARSVFLAIQKWLNVAKNFYTLEGYASDHADIVRDMSRLYRNLIYFESSEDRCCKLHKRRIDMLEAELSEFNPKYYLNVCRQLQFELAETYSEMMGIKLSLLEGDDEQLDRNHIVRKVNHLVKQSIKYFQMFLDTYKDKNGDMPEKYPEEQERPALLAHFFVARLHSKLIVSDPSEKIEQLRRSIEQYQLVSNYCKRNPTVVDDMKDELWICNEMIQLLPKKVDKILTGL